MIIVRRGSVSSLLKNWANHQYSASKCYFYCDLQPSDPIDLQQENFYKKQKVQKAHAHVGLLIAIGRGISCEMSAGVEYNLNWLTSHHELTFLFCVGNFHSSNSIPSSTTPTIDSLFLIR